MEHFHAYSTAGNQGQGNTLGFSNDIKVELANCEYLGMLVRNQCAFRATTFASKLKFTF